MFVAGDTMFFCGTDDKIWQMNTKTMGPSRLVRVPLPSHFLDGITGTRTGERKMAGCEEIQVIGIPLTRLTH